MDDIKERLNEIEEKGIYLMHKEPILGIDWDVAWLEKNSTLEVYTQLVNLKK